ncbi:MAG: DUF4351 domain-containing protein [Magnetococcales bacterium]|nr:DUF4351 domain-containing protein [Magnetococcales bacterium]
MKCFASRQEERKKAFKTIEHAGLLKLSVAFGRVMIGLWRLQMKNSLNNSEMEGITPEYVMQLGKEWFESMIDTTPEEELFSLPKLEHRLEWERKEGHQEGEAQMLLRLLQHRFGTLPEWVSKKIASSDLSSLETWSLRFVDAQSLDAIFADKSSCDK